MNLADFLYFFENYILLIYVKNESKFDLGWQYDALRFLLEKKIIK